MIVGMGIDLVEIERVRHLLQEHDGRARERIYTPAELALARTSANELETLAARFAAKEAAMKALGTGWTGGVAFRDFEIGRDAAGAPTLALSGVAATRAAALGVRRLHVSLTHTRGHAQACVILEG